MGNASYGKGFHEGSEKVFMKAQKKVFMKAQKMELLKASLGLWSLVRSQSY